MVADGVIECYALGGATAAFFYNEPDTTYDVDVFWLFKVGEESALNMLAPIYDYLRARGYQPEADHVNIHGVAVQFLPAYNPLIEEAVEHARDFDYLGVPVRVINPEYLVAIMLQTGRPKDYARVVRFLDRDAFDAHTLRQTLNRHGLQKAWTNLKLMDRRLAK
jgi:hypothetical protein